jgi:SEC-C motif
VRLSESKLREAILHPDPDIRDRATSYFAKSFSSDLSIMPLVIKAVETYGRQDDAYRLIGLSRDLPQCEDTIAWVIDELNDESCNKYENYAYNLSMVLVKADPAVLLSKESAVLEARHFLPHLHASFTERLRMLSWDMAICWQKLEEFCEEGKDKEDTSEINLGYANRIVEALARYGEECEEKVRILLSQKVDDFSHNPMNWLQPLAVRLAGEAQLESTIPLIITKLYEDAPFLGGDYLQALTQIGTPAVLQAISEAYPEAPFDFRLYASGPLEYIHSDLAVETCLLLLPQEKEWDLQRNLAHSLLSHLPQEGIEIVRKMLVGRELYFDDLHLRNYLVETCTIMGERFPEYNEWLAEEKAETEENRRRLKELEGDPYGTLAYALGKGVDKKTGDIPKANPSVPLKSLPSKPEARQKLGRNDPCPCKSGKKFKNCCMRK